MQSDADALTDLERRLAGCRPSPAGLDADAMLFAAGRAAAHRRGSRVIWPVIACGFALLSLGLGAALVGERAERLALADRLSGPPAVIAETSSPPVVPLSVPPDSYLAVRRQIEQGTDDWLAHPRPRGGVPVVPPPEPAILRASSGLNAVLQN